MWTPSSRLLLPHLRATMDSCPSGTIRESKPCLLEVTVVTGFYHGSRNVINGVASKQDLFAIALKFFPQRLSMIK